MAAAFLSNKSLSSASAPSQPAHPVCVVDDDPSVLKSVSRLLESEGFDVHAFPRAEECLDYITTHHVPVAILDVWMEPMTGMELLSHLTKSSPRTQAIFM